MPPIGIRTVLCTLALRRVIAQRQLGPDVIVMPAGRAEHHDDDRNQHQDDPRAFERLGDGDDDQDHAGRERAEAVDERARLPARARASAASG